MPNTSIRENVHCTFVDRFEAVMRPGDGAVMSQLCPPSYTEMLIKRACSHIERHTGRERRNAHFCCF